MNNLSNSNCTNSPRLGVDVPMPYATSLEAAALPQIRDVVAAVKSVLKVK